MIVTAKFDSQEVIGRLGRITEAQYEAGRRGMIRITTEIANRAKKRLRVRKGPGIGMGGRKTGALARSIIPSVTVSQTVIEGEVTAGVLATSGDPDSNYARYVEGWNKAGVHTPAANMANSYTPFMEVTLKEVLPDAADYLAGTVTLG